MNKQIKAGADIHAGDGGYSEGTQEQYDAFVKVRNKSLAQGRIRDLAEQAGSTHKQSLGVYQFYTDELEKFAELIVKECAKVIINGGYWSGGPVGPKRQCTPPEIAEMVKDVFGVKE